MYTSSWEADFEYELFEPRKDKWLDASTCLPNDGPSGGVDKYVTEDESSSVNEDKSSSEKKNEDDVTENGIRPRPANSQGMTSPLMNRFGWFKMQLTSEIS